MMGRSFRILVSIFFVAMFCLGAVRVVAEERTFESVSDWTELHDDEWFIVVNEYGSVAMGSNSFSPLAVDIADGGIVTSQPVLLFTLEREGDYAYLKTEDGLYLSNNSTSSTNGIILKAVKDETSKAKITGCDGYVTIQFEKNVAKSLLFYASGSMKRFSCYPSTYENQEMRRIQLYRYAGSHGSTSVTFASGGNVVVYKGHESEFVSPKASVTLSDGTLLGDAVLEYSSSNTDVATIDAATGDVTLCGLGTTTITATYKGDDEYNASANTYTLNYIKNTAYVTFGSGIDNSTFRVAIDEEGDFNAPKATLTPEDIGVLTYKSSDSDVATVDDDGNIVFGNKVGSAIITASFAGNDEYSAASASYTIARVNGTIVWSAANESFSNLSTSEIEKETSVIFTNADGDEYIFKVNGCSKTRQKNGILKFFSGRGRVKSPQLNAPNGYRLIVYYYKGSSLNALSLKAGSYDAEVYEEDKDVTASESEGVGYKATLDVADSSPFVITSIRECRVSKIVVEINHVDKIDLKEGTDNNEVIVANKDKHVDLTLDRPFYSDSWNTICLPFAVDAITLKSKFGTGVQLRGFGSVDVDNAVMYFNSVESITAGVPYLIKPDVYMQGISFEGVLIENDTPVRTGENGYYMQGVYNPTDIREDGTNLFLGEANKFYIPENGKNRMNAFRVYFVVPENTSSKALSYDTNGDTNGVIGIHVESLCEACVRIYSLDGRYVGDSTKTLSKGIYIVNGKKFVVR